MKIDDKTSHNSPSIRFPEFTGEWKEFSLGEIGDSFIGLTYKPTDTVPSGGIIVFRSSNIQDGCIDYKDIVRVNKKVRENLITKNGDLLICARNGSSRLIGKNALLHRTDANQTFGAFMMVFRSDKNHFVHHLLNTKRYTSQVAENLGARINQITSSDLSSFRFFFPKDDKEMTRIASLFDLLDGRIAVQNRLIDRLQSLMKGIRHRIINEAKGKIVCLCEVSDIYQPQTISSADLTETGYPVYGANGIIGHYTSYNHEAEQVCITCRGNTCGGVNYTKSKSWITGNAMVVNVDRYQNIVSKRYLYHYLSNCDFNSIISGSGQPQIVRAPLAKFKIILPTVMQQYKIAHCLDVIQNKINVNSNILNLLIRQKQYLLRKMFI